MDLVASLAYTLLRDINEHIRTSTPPPTHDRPRPANCISPLLHPHAFQYYILKITELLGCCYPVNNVGYEGVGKNWSAGRWWWPAGSRGHGKLNEFTPPA